MDVDDAAAVAAFVMGDASKYATPLVVRNAQRILDTARDAFIAMNSDGVITSWNAAAEQMFGYSRAEADGRQMSELIVPVGLRAAHDSALRRYVDTRIPRLAEQYGEYDAVHRSGRTFPVEITHWHLEVDGEMTFYAFLRDVTERHSRELELVHRRAREAELTHRTLHDALTGLANRTLALERLSHALARRFRHGGDLAVLFVDLDRFKLVNDNLGHDAGDELLCVTAARLTASVRGSDSVARVSGDEFVVICPDLAGRGEAMMIAGRILDALQVPLELSGERVRIRGSVGIAFADAPDDTAEDLLRDADAAMYRAKENGRAQVAIFDDGMRQRLRNQLHMEREIVEALERDELRVWYRPIVDLRSGQVSGMQPMIAWQHPRLGLLEPMAFTPVAEEIGVMPTILDWAIREICRQCVRWQQAGGTGVSIDIDLTARQIEHPAFVESLASALQAAGLPGSALTISVLPPPGPPPSRNEALLAALDTMRAQGVVVGINGCGVDSAVLSWLADIPFDVLRIAPELGAAIGTRPRADAVVAALVEMAHRMVMRTSIDGLLTAAQRDRAAALGCDLGQGAVFGTMAPPQAIVTPIAIADRAGGPGVMHR